MAHSRLIPLFFIYFYFFRMLASSSALGWVSFFFFFFFFYLFLFYFFTYHHTIFVFVRAGDIPSSARRQICLCILRRKIKDYNNNYSSDFFEKGSCEKYTIHEEPFGDDGLSNSQKEQKLVSTSILRILPSQRHVIYSSDSLTATHVCTARDTKK